MQTTGFDSNNFRDGIVLVNSQVLSMTTNHAETFYNTCGVFSSFLDGGIKFGIAERLSKDNVHSLGDGGKQFFNQHIKVNHQSDADNPSHTVFKSKVVFDPNETLYKEDFYSSVNVSSKIDFTTGATLDEADLLRCISIMITSVGLEDPELQLIMGPHLYTPETGKTSIKVMLHKLSFDEAVIDEDKVLTCRTCSNHTLLLEYVLNHAVQKDPLLEFINSRDSLWLERAGGTNKK